MSSVGGTYDIVEQQSDKEIQYFFVSSGKKGIVKVIQYIFIENVNGISVFNLGFGDYDLEKEEIIDDVNTNNGDTYKVFNTVLSTIPLFFAIHNNSMLMVEGSDSRPDFVEHCKLTCLKNCSDECKNFNRRINVYRNYVNKNYSELIKLYSFYGGYTDKGNNANIEPYESGKEYSLVFLLKRNS